MKKIVLTAAAFLIAFLSLILMYSLKLEEKVQIWTNYNVVYVSKDYSEAEVFSLCKDGGVEGVISRENSLFTVKNHMLPTLKPYENEGFTSQSMRDFFFTDKSTGYFLMYVPSDSLDGVTQILKSEHIPFGVDATVEYPVLCPILCFASFLILMFVNRIDFIKALCLIPLVSVSYAVPFYSVAAGIICLLFVFCIIDLYEMRHGAIRTLLKKPSLWLSLVSGLVAASFSGKTAILLFITGLISSTLLLFIRFMVIRLKIEECHFKSVYIVNAKWININRRYNAKTLLTVIVSCVCFVILSVFSLSPVAGINSQDLLLPAPSSYTVDNDFSASSYAQLRNMHDDERNPDLSDFLNEKWYSETAAYRKVNDTFTTAEADEKVVLPSFRETDEGIVEKDRTMFSFDDDYISSATQDFNEREGVEKLLVSEDGFYTTGYAASGKKETSTLILPATVICAICFILLFAVYCIKRLKK